jgi:essential nuclear protein 1
MPKATSATKNHKPRHTPLHVDISKDSDMQKFGRVASTNSKKGKDRASRVDAEAEGEDKESGVVGGRMSRKILDLARDQQEEVMGEMEDDDDEDEDEDDDEEEEEDVRAVGTGQRVKRPDADEEEDLEEGDVSDEEYAELVSHIIPADLHRPVETAQKLTMYLLPQYRRLIRKTTKP